MALNYSNLLTPNPKATLPKNNTVPNLLKGLSPAQSALNTYTNPATLKPPTGGSSPIGGQSKLPTGGYDSGVGKNPVKKIENKNSGIVTTYDTKSATGGQSKPTKETPSGSTPPVAPTASTVGKIDMTDTSGSKMNLDVNSQLDNIKKQLLNIQTASQGVNAPPPKPTYGGLVGTLASTAQDTSAIDRANQGLLKLRQDYSTAVGNIENTPIPLNFQQGRAQVLGRQFASQEAAQQSALSNELAARGQNIQGLSSAAGLMAPRSAGSGYVIIDPTTGQPVGDAASAGQAAARGAGIEADAASSGQITGDINSINSQKTALDNSMSILNTYTQQLGLPANIPIIQGLRNLFGSTLEASPQVAGFRNQLNQVRAMAQSLGIPSEGITENMLPSQLAEVQKAIKDTLELRLINLQQTLGGLQGTGGTTGGTGSTGGLYDW